MPRPMRFRAFRACAGCRDDRLSCSAILDLDQVADLPKHACQDRAVVVLHGLADLAEPERAESAAVLLALADLATRLGYSDFRHLLSPAVPPAPRRPVSGHPGLQALPTPPLPRDACTEALR